jgi:membrane protein DedA with SNARE-associated domain
VNPTAILQWAAAHGPLALFGLLMLGVFGLPVPDETLLTFAGVLVRHGRLGFATAWGSAALGSMCGITLSYVLGRTAGTAVVHRYGGWLRITEGDVRRVEQWMEHGGRWTLMFGYFVPGVRHLTAIVAGSSSLPLSIFSTFAYGGAVLWSLTFITLGWYVGDRWETVLSAFHRHVTAVAVVAAGVLATYAIFHLRRSRR